ncbi:MAG: DUF6134 family protein [Gemmataceae bacterium]|nr:DUF6134 family protein [Gemmataceae bacterium]MCI0739668.1 DUF6134 family protein [Gemmataceae bacterium]
MPLSAGCRFLVAWSLAACWSSVARASHTEQRDYSILVDGKEAGQSRMTIVTQDDGTTVVSGTARVDVRLLIGNYSVRIDGTEWWKDGKLIGVRSSTVENGKKTEVVVSVDGNQLRARVNGQDKAVRADVWTNSFWKLADARFHNKPVPVFEVDSGKEHMGQLNFIGTEQLTIANQPQACYRFRVTGGAYPVDVWFDRYHRMVRQEFVESGHKTIVQLLSVRR